MWGGPKKLGLLTTSVGGSGPASNTVFRGPPGVFTLNSILICVQPFLHSEAGMSRVTDTANIGKNRLHLMRLMRPKKWNWPNPSYYVL